MRLLGTRGRADAHAHFSAVDLEGQQPTEEIEAWGRIDRLRIPPAWRDVWISPRPGAKLPNGHVRRGTEAKKGRRSKARQIVE